MSKQTQPEQEEITNDDEYELLDINSAEDYGFIFGPDGELKHLFTPDGFFIDPPTVIKKILKILGIKDINSIGSYDSNDTLH